MQPQLLYGADQSDCGKPRPSLAKHKSHRFDSTVWLVYLTCGLHEFPRRAGGGGEQFVAVELFVLGVCTYVCLGECVHMCTCAR